MSLNCPSVSFSKSDYRCSSFDSAQTVGAGWYFFFNSIKFHTLTKQQENCTWCVQVLRSPKNAFAVAMQSWRERCEKCVCLQGDYVER